MNDFDSYFKANKNAGKSNERGYIDRLLELVHDKDFNVRHDAIIALGNSGDARAVKPLIDILKEGSSLLRAKASKALIRTGKQAVAPLIQALKDPHLNKSAASVLSNLGKNAIEPLIAALKDGDENVRWWAAKVLGWTTEPHAVEPLIAALKDEEAYVQESVIEALGTIKDPRTVEPLIGFLLTCKENNLQILAAKTLAELKDSRAVGPIITILSNTSIEDKGYSKRKQEFKKALEILGLDDNLIEEKIENAKWQLFKYDLRQELDKLPVNSFDETQRLWTGHNVVSVCTTKDEAYNELISFLGSAREGATSFHNPVVHSIPGQRPSLKVEFFHHKGAVEYLDGVIVGRTGANEFTLLRPEKRG